MFGFFTGHAINQGLGWGARQIGQALQQPGKKGPKPQPPAPPPGGQLGKPRNPPPNPPDRPDGFFAPHRTAFSNLHAQGHGAAMAYGNAAMAQHAANMQQSNDIIGRAHRENADRVSRNRAYDAQLGVAQAQAQAQVEAARHAREAEMAKAKYTEDAKTARNQQILALLQNDQGSYAPPGGMAQPYYGYPGQTFSHSMRVSSRRG